MKITIIGSGCPTCESLHKMVQIVVKENSIKAEVEYVKDVTELINRGIMGSPALLVDDKSVKVGMPKNKEELLQIINKNSK